MGKRCLSAIDEIDFEEEEGAEEGTEEGGEGACREGGEGGGEEGGRAARSKSEETLARTFALTRAQLSSSNSLMSFENVIRMWEENKGENKAGETERRPGSPTAIATNSTSTSSSRLLTSINLASASTPTSTRTSTRTSTPPPPTVAVRKLMLKRAALSGWFLGADCAKIRRGNVAQWVAWAFFLNRPRHLDAAQSKEMEAIVQEVRTHHIIHPVYTPFIHPLYTLYSRTYTYVHPLYMYIHHIYTEHTSKHL